MKSHQEGKVYLKERMKHFRTMKLGLAKLEFTKQLEFTKLGVGLHLRSTKLRIS